MLMKTILVTALVGALASPAFAVTKRHANTRAHAQAQQTQRHSSNPSYDAYNKRLMWEEKWNQEDDLGE